jgi:hypothetical protein
MADDFIPDNPKDDFIPDQQSNQGPSFMSRVWENLKVPEQVIGQGYRNIANVMPNGGEPSGNLPLDIAKGTPKVLAESAAQVLPKLYSRSAIVGELAGNALGSLGEVPQIQQAVGAIGKLGAKGIEAITGIPKENVVNLFKSPMRLFSAPTKSEVNSAYGSSELANNAPKAIEDIVQEGTASSPALVRRAGKALLNPEADIANDPSVFLEGRKAIDKELATIQSQLATAPAGKSTSALTDAMARKVALREEFNNALDILAPEFRKADALASERYGVLPFRHVFLPGKINFISPTGMSRAIPGLPTAIGLSLSGLGLAAKGASKIAPYLGNAGGVAGAAMGFLNSSENPSSDDLDKKAQ